MNNEENENDNLYFLFKDTSNRFDKEKGFWAIQPDAESIKDNKIFDINPKLNELKVDWSPFQQFLHDLSEDKDLFPEESKPIFDTSPLERRLISLLDTVESLLEYLEDRRQNHREGNF